MEATTINWRPDKYKDSPLCISDWAAKQGWDFVGAIVDIQLRHALLDEGLGDWSAGDYFWVKYTGTIEGFEDSNNNGEKVNYHFGVETFNQRHFIFRDDNICDVRIRPPKTPPPSSALSAEEAIEDNEEAPTSPHQCWLGCV